MSRTCNFFDKVLCSISCNSLANQLNQTKSKINVSSCAKLKNAINRNKSSGKYKKFRAARRYHKSGRLRSEFQDVASTSPKCKLNEKSSPFYRSLYAYKRPHKIKSPEKRFRHLHYDDTDIIKFSRKINAFRACRNGKDKIAWPPIYKYKGEPKRKVSPLPFKRLYKKKFVKRHYPPEDLQPIYPTKTKPVSELPKQEKIEIEAEKPQETQERKHEEVESLKNKIKIHKESFVAVDNIKRMQYKFEKMSKTNNILMGQYLKMSIEKELDDLKKTSPKVFSTFVNENHLLDCKTETRRNEIKQDLKPIYPNKIEFENEKAQNDDEKVRFTVVEKLLEHKNTQIAAEQEKERLKTRFNLEGQNKTTKTGLNSKSKQNMTEMKEKERLKTKLSNEKLLKHHSGAFNNILFRTLTTDAKDKPIKLKTTAYEPLYRFKKDEPKTFKMKKLPEKFTCKPESKMQKNVASLKKLIQEKLGSKKVQKAEVPATAVCAAIRKISCKSEISKEKKPRFDITPRMTSPNIVDNRDKGVKKAKYKKKPIIDKTVIKDVFQSEEPLKIKKDCETPKCVKELKTEEKPKTDTETLKNKISTCANEINIEVNLKKEPKKVEKECVQKVESPKRIESCAKEVKKECPNVKEIEANLINELRSEVRKACEKSINELKTEFSKACTSIREQKAKSLKRKTPCLTETLEELYSASIKEVESISKCLEAPKRSRFDEIISKITEKICSKKEPKKEEKPKSKKKRRETPEKHVFKNPNVFDCRDRNKGNFKVEISADVPIKVEKDGQFIHATISLPKTEKKKWDNNKKLLVPVLQVAAAAVAKDKDQIEKCEKPKKEEQSCLKTNPSEEQLCVKETEQQVVKSNGQSCPEDAKEDASKNKCAEVCSRQGDQQATEPVESSQKESSDVPVCSWPKESSGEPIINETVAQTPVQAECLNEQEKKEDCSENAISDEEKDEEKTRETLVFRPSNQVKKNDQSKVDLKAIRSTFARGGRKTRDPTEIEIPEVQSSLFNCQDPFLKCFLTPDSETITCLVESRQKAKLCGEETHEKPVVRTKERVATVKRKKADPVFNHRCITVPKSAYRLKLPTETANYEKTWYTDMTKNRKNSSVQVHK